jgi:hypothetical protein
MREIRHVYACGQTHFNCQCGMYQMPFGKHRGKTLSEIDNEEKGRQYLQWLVDNIDPSNARDFIESYLVRFSK